MFVFSLRPNRCPHKITIYWYYYACGNVWCPGLIHLHCKCRVKMHFCGNQ